MDQKFFEEVKLDKGCKCPTCGQLAKIYKRQIYDATAKWLIYVNRFFGSGEWFHIKQLTLKLAESNIDPTLPVGAGENAKLRFWGLIEQKPVEEGKDIKSSGTWRITQKGIAFVKKELSIPKYIHLYDGNLQGFSGPLVTIEDCLKKKFNYLELMGS